MIGWLVPTLNLSALNTLASVIQEVADLSDGWVIRLIEAAPRRRGWVCDLDGWLKEHPVLAACFDKMVPYQTSELACVDMIVSMPCELADGQQWQKLNAAIDSGSEEACWVVLQAIAARVPLLGCSSLRSWFAGAEDPGLFIEPDGPKVVARALREFAQDAALRQRCSDAAGRVAELQFSREATLEALTSLYAAALSEPLPFHSGDRSRRKVSSNWGRAKL